MFTLDLSKPRASRATPASRRPAAVRAYTKDDLWGDINDGMLARALDHIRAVQQRTDEHIAEIESILADAAAASTEAEIDAVIARYRDIVSIVDTYLQM